MVDSVVSLFLEKLVGILKTEGGVIIEFHDQFDDMKRQLRLMQCFLKDADRKRRKNNILRAITDELVVLIYEAENILSECHAKGLGFKYFRSNHLSCFSPRTIPYRYHAGKRLTKINLKIAKIKNDMASYLTPALSTIDVVEESVRDATRWSPPIFDKSQIVGLEKETQKIKQWLFESNSVMNVIGIVGMGGLGKSTTARMVFSDREIEGRYVKKIWVSVSQTVKEKEIMRTILKNLGDASIGDENAEMLMKIHQYLLGNNYLIVMDDVWELKCGWWARLSSGLPKNSGGAVIITTRNEQIAREMGVVEKRIHRPKLLRSDVSWSLFCNNAFPARNIETLDTRLMAIGMELVEKCGGLPLAIKAVGGMMSYKAHSISEWKRISENFREELAETSDSVVASLQLSYDELPSHLKPCFLCLSIYPEDCVILKDQLIHWWIAEGFVPIKNGRSLVESGEECFSGLMNRCLIEAADGNLHIHGKILCMVHDMVLELAIRLGKEESFCNTDNEASLRRCAISCIMDEKNLKSNPTLRALVSTTSMEGVNNIGLTAPARLSYYRNLKVLDLSESVFEMDVEKLLNKIHSPWHLAFLSLRNTHPLNGLPESVKKLTSLQILDLSFCINLQVLPSFILRLKNLIVLDVSGCGSIKHFPKGLGGLSCLQVLKGFRPSEASYPEGCRFGELKGLVRLRLLELWLTRSEEIDGTETDALLHLQDLQILKITCFQSYGDGLIQKLDLLSVPEQLSQLYLSYFPGQLTPLWLNPTALPQLQFLSISHSNCSLNPSFWGDNKSSSWRIEGLVLESLPHLDEEWANFKCGLVLLRVMSISWCPKLRNFPVYDFAFKGSIWRKEDN